MGGDAFLFLFFWFSQTNKKQQQEKILIPQATQIVLNLFLFKDFFFCEVIIRFCSLCPGWNAHAKGTEFYVRTLRYVVYTKRRYAVM